MLRYFTINPPVELRKYVRSFWVLEGTASPENPYFHRSMADGGAELLFHYKGRFDEIFKNDLTDLSFQCGVHAPSSDFRRFTISENFGMIGAYVYPYALSIFLKLPVSEIVDSMHELDLLTGQEGKDLSERIMTAGDNSTRVEILSKYFLSCVAGNPEPDKRIQCCINEVILSKGRMEIDTLASKYFLSTRHFQRLFKTFSGFNPQQFVKITRFQSTLQEFGQMTKSLTEIAHDYGYYDQSHFNHDFRKFSGFHPREYFMQRSEANDWKTVL